MIPGDFDRDGDVDYDDVNAFTKCMDGPVIPLSSGCEDKDLDNDGDGDMADFDVLQGCFSGTDHPGDPNCAG